MLYYSMDFGELTLDCLIDTGSYFSAIPEADLKKIRLLAPQAIIKDGSAPSFQIMVANGDIETPKGSVELKFEMRDIEFHEIFIVMEKLSSAIIGLMFFHRNHNVLDMRQGILNFPYFLMQFEMLTTNIQTSWKTSSIPRTSQFLQMASRSSRYSPKLMQKTQ